MQACLVRPDGLRPGERLPDGALLIGHAREPPGLLAAGIEARLVAYQCSPTRSQGVGGQIRNAAETETRRSKICINPTYVWTGRGPYIQLLV